MFAEIKLHRALQHPNIVEFEDCFEDEEHVYMTMALCENGVRGFTTESALAYGAHS